MSRSAPRSTSPQHRPSRRAKTIGLAAAATLLSACGLVAAFVPPLSVGDPLGVDERVTLSGPSGGTVEEHPARFTVTRAVVEGTLEDDVNGAVSFTRSVGLSLSFARAGCDVGVCTYTYEGDEALEDVLNIELTDRDELERLVSILLLRETETTNCGTFRVGLEIESDTAMAGYTVGFMLTSEGSKIRLGG